MKKGYHPECNNCEGKGKVLYLGKKYECPVCMGRGKMLGTTCYDEPQEAK